MAQTFRVECEFCFTSVRFTARSLHDTLSCKRCAQNINWQQQLEDNKLSSLKRVIAASDLDLASTSPASVTPGNFGASLTEMPWQVRFIAVMHAILMFYKVTNLITMLITNKVRSPGLLLLELAMISFAFWTYYGIHYRSRATWMTLKNFSKFNMYLFTIIGICLSLMFVVLRPQILIAFFPIWGLIWLFFSIDYLLLRTKEARQYFNVICPKCHALETKPFDSSFKFVRCKKCQHVWS